jgi:microcystin-dependent protein
MFSNRYLQCVALAEGQFMPINQNQALFSLLGMDVSGASRIILKGNRPRTTIDRGG